MYENASLSYNYPLQIIQRSFSQYVRNKIQLGKQNYQFFAYDMFPSFPLHIVGKVLQK